MDLKQLMFEAHDNSVRKGFWEDADRRNKGEMIALMHSELSELLEVVRKDFAAPSEKISGYTHAEEEAADLLIRLADFCEGFGLDLDGATKAKMAYNTGRPYKHGKLF